MKGDSINRARVFGFALAALAGVCLAGCRRTANTAPHLGIWGSSSYWHAPEQTGTRPLPGIEQASVAMAMRIHSGGVQESGSEGERVTTTSGAVTFAARCALGHGTDGGTRFAQP